MKTIILQNVSTTETRAIIQAIALADKNEYILIRSDIKDLEKHIEVLEYGTPIGSVEFVREAMRIAEIIEPEINPYPNSNFKYLKRNINKVKINDIDTGKTWFIKPVKLKLFNGFVLDAGKLYEDYSDHDKEQLDILNSIQDDFVWASDVILFESEWRYYIHNSNIVGYARYDENEEDDVLEPNQTLINEYITELDYNYPYVLDFGVLDTGETVLVEYNDFWAIGLYSNALSPKKYLAMLIERFDVIRVNYRNQLSL